MQAARLLGNLARRGLGLLYGGAVGLMAPLRVNPCVEVR